MLQPVYYLVYVLLAHFVSLQSSFGKSTTFRFLAAPFNPTDISFCLHTSSFYSLQILPFLNSDQPSSGYPFFCLHDTRQYFLAQAAVITAPHFLSEGWNENGVPTVLGAHLIRSSSCWQTAIVLSNKEDYYCDAWVWFLQCVYACVSLF